MMDMISMPVNQDTAINSMPGNQKPIESGSDTSFANALDSAVKEAKEPQIEIVAEDVNAQEPAKPDVEINEDVSSAQMSMAAMAASQFIATDTNLAITVPSPDAEAKIESNNVSVVSDNQMLQVLENSLDIKTGSDENETQKQNPIAQNANVQNNSSIEEALVNMTPVDSDSETIDLGKINDSNLVLRSGNRPANQVSDENMSSGIVNEMKTQQQKEVSKNHLKDNIPTNTIPVTSVNDKTADVSVETSIETVIQGGVNGISDSGDTEKISSESSSETIDLGKINNSNLILRSGNMSVNQVSDENMSSGIVNEMKTQQQPEVSENHLKDNIPTNTMPVSSAYDKTADVSVESLIETVMNGSVNRGLDNADTKKISSESSSEISSVKAETGMQTDLIKSFPETIKASVQATASNNTKQVENNGAAFKSTSVDDSTALQSNLADIKATGEEPVKLTASAKKQANVQEAFFVGAQVKANNSQKNIDNIDLSNQIDVNAAVMPSVDTDVQVGINMGSDTEDSNDSGSESTNQTSSMQAGVSVQTNTVKSFFETIKASNQAGTSNNTQLVHKQVADQIIKDVKLLQGIDRSDIVVRLTPPDLGTLRVQITQDASGISSQIVADNTKARDLLQANVSSLMETLSNAGVKMDRVSVTSESSFNTFAGNTGFANERNMQHNFRQNTPTYSSFMNNAQMHNGMQLETAAYETSAHSWLA